MRHLANNLLAGLAGATAALAMAGAAQSATIAYTISGSGSGSLGGVAFTDTAFDILLLGDPDNVWDFGLGASAITPLQSATVRIDGFTDAGLTEATRLGVSRLVDIFFFSRDDGFGGGVDLFDFRVTNAQETAFDYAAPYGPVPGFDIFVAQFHDVGTSQGSLTFQTASDVLFSAAAVPEPGAWALMIVGFGGVGAVVRRRRNVAGVEGALRCAR